MFCNGDGALFLRFSLIGNDCLHVPWRVERDARARAAAYATCTIPPLKSFDLHRTYHLDCLEVKKPKGRSSRRVALSAELWVRPVPDRPKVR